MMFTNCTFFFESITTSIENFAFRRAVLRTIQIIGIIAIIIVIITIIMIFQFIINIIMFLATFPKIQK